MTKIIQVLFYLLGVTIFGYSQTTDYSQFNGSSVKVSTTHRLTEPYFHGYNPNYIAAAFYKSQDQFKYSTVEELLTALFSSDTKERYEACFLNGKATAIANEVLKRRSSADTLTNYFSLIHKLEFQHEGKLTSIVKYFEIKEGKKDARPSSIQAQQVNGRWYITTEPALNDLEYTFRLLKTDAFWLVKSKQPSKDPDINYIIENSKDESKVLNITKLAAILREWDEKNYTDKLAKICDI
ncbi:MAG: hypothetical protein K2X86_06445 [Cytophagaceae bacterium]|nr:hypothetical protein [Cytophagaceae bacterium]